VGNDPDRRRSCTIISSCAVWPAGENGGSFSLPGGGRPGNAAGLFDLTGAPEATWTFHYLACSLVLVLKRSAERFALPDRAGASSTSFLPARPRFRPRCAPRIGTTPTPERPCVGAKIGNYESPEDRKDDEQPTHNALHRNRSIADGSAGIVHDAGGGRSGAGAGDRSASRACRPAENRHAGRAVPSQRNGHYPRPPPLKPGIVTSQTSNCL
jgi:hypothetical protein